MRKFGLVGFPIGHSFSKKYFTDKFQSLNLEDHQYDLYELETVDGFMDLWNDKDLIGVNVTVPHKQNVIPFMTKLDGSAERVGAINVIRREKEGLVGYNSDYYGFKNSLINFISGASVKKALILGTGGASKAVRVALADLGIEYKEVSRTKDNADHTYAELHDRPSILIETDLIINCTPLGTFPKTDYCADLPYNAMHSNQFLYDLVYNPEVTSFMKKGLEQGAKVKNGAEMLKLQAERSWEIWNS